MIFLQVVEDFFALDRHFITYINSDNPTSFQVTSIILNISYIAKGNDYYFVALTFSF